MNDFFILAYEMSELKIMQPVTIVPNEDPFLEETTSWEMCQTEVLCEWVCKSRRGSLISGLAWIASTYTACLTTWLILLHIVE